MLLDHSQHSIQPSMLRSQAVITLFRPVEGQRPFGVATTGLSELGLRNEGKAWPRLLCIKDHPSLVANRFTRAISTRPVVNPHRTLVAGLCFSSSGASIEQTASGVFPCSGQVSLDLYQVSMRSCTPCLEHSHRTLCRLRFAVSFLWAKYPLGTHELSS